VAKRAGSRQVLHPQRAARDLVFVRGADAPARRADLRVAHPGFARLIESDVHGSTSGHAGEMRRRERISIPAASSSRISVMSADGDSTTPLPM
jgi:hypothetical protein